MGEMENRKRVPSLFRQYEDLIESAKKKKRTSVQTRSKIPKKPFIFTNDSVRQQAEASLREVREFRYDTYDQSNRKMRT